MTLSWLFHVFLMNFLRLSHDFLMNFSWISHDFLMTFSWLHLDFLWLFYDFFMAFSWLSHGFFMTLSWISHEFLMTSHELLKRPWFVPFWPLFFPALSYLHHARSLWIPIATVANQVKHLKTQNIWRTKIRLSSLWTFAVVILKFYIAKHINTHQMVGQQS